MSRHIAYLLLGLGSGAVYGALAVASTVTYRVSGVVNVATGAMAALGGYSYGYLRRGELFLPVPGLPVTVDLGGELPVLPAAAGALAISALVGLLLYVGVFRWLTTAPPAAGMVASVGVMVAIQSILAMRLGTNPIAVPHMFPTEPIDVFGVGVSRDRIFVSLTLLTVAALLTAVFRWTGFGLATQAVADNEKGAVLTGLDPVRIGVANWALSGAVAGLAGILISPIVALQPATYTLFVIPALAAAVLGRMSSILVAMGAGLLIGMVQADVVFLQADLSWLPTVGVPESVPLVAMMLVLVVAGRPLPIRGTLIDRGLGSAPRPRAIAKPAVLAGLVGLVLLLTTDGSLRGGVITTFTMAVVALSWVVITGYAGQVSVAQLTLAGVGGFLVAGPIRDWGIPFPFSFLLAALGAAVVGVVVGLPALRVRGLSLLIVTLAMGSAIENLLLKNVRDAGDPLGGPYLFGIDLSIGAGRDYPRVEFGLLALTLLLATATAVALLRRSRLGARMLAVRSNERSAAATGIDVRATKVAALAISSAIAGVGGALIAYEQTVLSAASYSVLASLGLFTTVYLAGISSVSGGVLAGVLAVSGVLSTVLDRYIEIGFWFPLVSGAILAVVMILHPEGISSDLARHAERRHREHRRAAIEADEPSGPPAEGMTRVPSFLHSQRGAASGATALAIEGLTVRYGGVVAVDQVDIRIRRGTTVGLIGPNGAGKTTLIDAISGLVASEGTVSLGSTPLTALRPHDRARLGLGRTFQSGELWDDLTVYENVCVGLRGRQSRSDADEAMSFLGLDAFADDPVAELSQGRRRLVAVARSLVAGPEVLLLDEPAAGLDSAESRWLAARLKLIGESGMTMLIVDHDMSFIMSICDEVNVLDFGRLLASGPPAVIRRDPAVITAYLGTSTTAMELA